MRHLLIKTTLIVVFCAEMVVAGDPSTIFLPGRYSHSATTGERTMQFAAKPKVEAMPDTRPYTSGYNFSRITQRGLDGSVRQYYRVQNFANGRGELNAEWERFNDVWQRSVLWGSRGYPGYGTPGYGPSHPGPIGPPPGSGGGWGYGYLPTQGGAAAPAIGPTAAAVAGS